jgi:hypothetical protein
VAPGGPLPPQRTADVARSENRDACLTHPVWYGSPASPYFADNHARRTTISVSLRPGAPMRKDVPFSE